MPPQPLSFASPRARPQSGTLVMSRHPNLAHIVGDLISFGSLVEHQWALTLSEIARTQPRTVMAMHGALKSTVAQRDVLDAVVDVLLSHDMRLLFKKIRKASQAATKIRNSFCHHIWCECEELPDALLLIDPVVLTEWRVSTLEENYRRLDTSKVLVYPEAALVEARNEVHRALTMAERFTCFSPTMTDETHFTK